MGYLAKSDDLSFNNLKRSVIMGSAMASFAVEQFGPKNLYDLDETKINARVEEFRSLISF